MKSKRQDLTELILEFFSALRNGQTYLPHRNPETLFGLLWGLPVPVFALAIHLHAAGLPWRFQTLSNILIENPIYLVFVLHPLIFAVIFGAHGTMRARRDAKIQALIAELEKHCEELSAANSKLAQLDRLKSEFLANVTHELKSPLVTALGYSSLILNEKLGSISERQRNAIEVSQRNLIRLRKLIEEVLEFSRLEAGVGKFKIETIDLKEVLNAATDDLLLKARERNIAISTDLPDGNALIQGDTLKLTQAFENLLDNAIKFSTDGATVRVALASEAGFWHLQFTNQGAGIAPETMPHLFQRFSQADGSPSRPYNGVGLGLVIVKKIVEAHQGEVWLESQLGASTTAHVKFTQSPESPMEKKEASHATRAIG